MTENIVNESLISLDQYLNKLIPGIKDTIKYFSEDKEDKALKLLIESIEGINWTLEVIMLTKPTLEEYNIKVNEDKIKEVLLEFEKALENEDFVYVNDLLEYELLDMLIYWKEGLAKIKLNTN